MIRGQVIALKKNEENWSIEGLTVFKGFISEASKQDIQSYFLEDIQLMMSYLISWPK